LAVQRLRLRAFWISKPDRTGDLIAAGSLDGKVVETGDDGSLNANDLSVE
jgi:hypothetical protein